MNKKLILVLSFCHKDKALAMEQMKYLNETGFTKETYGKGRTIILAHNHQTNVAGIKTIVSGMFDKVEEFVPKDSYEHGWPTACNHQFVRCAEHVQKRGVPFLFLEADAVILHPDFLDVLEADYNSKKKPFLGRVIRLHDENTDHLTGISVYPPNIFDLIGKISIGGEAWDYQMRHKIVPLAGETRFIQQIWNPNVFQTILDLSDIEKDTRIFHRCKDGSLIRLIRRKRVNAQKSLEVLTADERTILQDLQRETIDLRNKLKEVLDLREGTGRNPRVAIRNIDRWINENRNLI